MLDKFLGGAFGGEGGAGMGGKSGKKATKAEMAAKKVERRTEELKRLGVKPKPRNKHPDWKAAGGRGECDPVLPGTRGWKVMHTGARTNEPPAILRPASRCAEAALPADLRPGSAPVPTNRGCQTVARDRYSRCFGSDLFGRNLEAGPRRLPEYARRIDVPMEERDVVRRSARTNEPGDQPAGQGGSTVLRPPPEKGGMDGAAVIRPKLIGARADTLSEHMQFKHNEGFVLHLKERIPYEPPVRHQKRSSNEPMSLNMAKSALAGHRD